MAIIRRLRYTHQVISGIFTSRAGIGLPLYLCQCPGTRQVSTLIPPPPLLRTKLEISRVQKFLDLEISNFQLCMEEGDAEVERNAEISGSERSCVFRRAAGSPFESLVLNKNDLSPSSDVRQQTCVM